MRNILRAALVVATLAPAVSFADAPKTDTKTDTTKAPAKAADPKAPAKADPKAPATKADPKAPATAPATDKAAPKAK